MGRGSGPAWTQCPPLRSDPTFLSCLGPHTSLPRGTRCVEGGRGHAGNEHRALHGGEGGQCPHPPHCPFGTPEAGPSLHRFPLPRRRKRAGASRRPAGGTRTRAACPAADGATSPPDPVPCDGWTARGAESRADRRSTLYFRTVIARAPKPRRRVPRKDSLSGVRGRTVSVVGRGFCGQGPNGRRLAGPVR